MARKPAKPARRKPGTGSIRHKAGREKPWEAAFPIGRREYRYDSFATEAHARAHLDRLTAERDHVETPRNIAGGSQYLEAFLVAFLNRKAIKVKAKTLADYTYQCGLANEYCGYSPASSNTAATRRSVESEAARHCVALSLSASARCSAASRHASVIGSRCSGQY